jgi:hypothetical protein
VADNEHPRLKNEKRVVELGFFESLSVFVLVFDKRFQSFETDKEK